MTIGYRHPLVSAKVIMRSPYLFCGHAEVCGVLKNYDGSEVLGL